MNLYQANATPYMQQMPCFINAMIINEGNMPIYGVPVALAPVIPVYSQLDSQVVFTHGSNKEPVEKPQLFDLFSESTNASPKGLARNMLPIPHNLEQQNCANVDSIHNYCICNCSDSLSKQSKMEVRPTLNQICGSLNASNGQVVGGFGDHLKMMQNRPVTQLSHDARRVKHQKPTSSQCDFPQLSNKKTFKITRFPKSTLSKAKRLALVAKDRLESAQEGEAKPVLQVEDLSERQAAFGDKRDDLFYKTIGRDVRKLLQEQFQSFLGGKGFKECVKSATFFEFLNEFFASQILAQVGAEVDAEKLMVCVATLVSYQGFAPFCPDSLKKMSLEIHDSLHNFTKVKLVKLCQMAEFKQVFKYYAGEMEKNGFRRFSEHRTMKSNVRGYKYAFTDILKQCN